MKKRSKIALGIVIVAAAAAAGLAMVGYRLTALQAAMSSLNIKGDKTVVGEVRRDWGSVFVLKTGEGMKTALAERKGFLWRCSMTGYVYDDIIQNDGVKTVGWVSCVLDNHEAITLLAIEAKDPKVKVLEAGLESNRQTNAVSAGDTVLFTWDKLIPFADLNAAAKDGNDHELYQYEYNPKTPTSTRTEELKWYAVQGIKN